MSAARMRVRTTPVGSLGHIGMAEYDGFVHAMNGDSASMFVSPLIWRVVQLPHEGSRDV